MTPTQKRTQPSSVNTAQLVTMSFLTPGWARWAIFSLVGELYRGDKSAEVFACRLILLHTRRDSIKSPAWVCRMATDYRKSAEMCKVWLKANLQHLLPISSDPFTL